MSSVPIDPSLVRRDNVRVPLHEFLNVWLHAERGLDTASDRYLEAVVQTCRWMAAVPMRTALCGGLARSPVTLRACVADRESIAAEWQASRHDGRFWPELVARPGWCDGVRATLEWAWCGQGHPPVAVPAVGARGVDQA